MFLEPLLTLFTNKEILERFQQF